MKIRKKLITSAMIVVMMMSAATTALAGQWQQNSKGWWWQEDNGTYPKSQWQWIDGNKDGIAECYYFDNSGYMLSNTTTPDGYVVNGDGAWTEGGAVKTKNVSTEQIRQTARMQIHRLRQPMSIAEPMHTILALTRFQ